MSVIIDQPAAQPSSPGSAAPPSQGWPRSFTGDELRVMIEAFSGNWWASVQMNLSQQGVDCAMGLTDWCAANTDRQFNDRSHLRNSLYDYLTRKRERAEHRNAARPVAGAGVQERLNTMQQVKEIDQAAPPVFDRPRRAAGQ